MPRKRNNVVDLALYRVQRRIDRMLEEGLLDEYPSWHELMVEYVAEVIQALPEAERGHPALSKLDQGFLEAYLRL